MCVFRCLQNVIHLNIKKKLIQKKNLQKINFIISRKGNWNGCQFSFFPVNMELPKKKLI